MIGDFCKITQKYLIPSPNTPQTAMYRAIDDGEGVRPPSPVLSPYISPTLSLIPNFGGGFGEVLGEGLRNPSPSLNHDAQGDWRHFGEGVRYF